MIGITTSRVVHWALVIACMVFTVACRDESAVIRLVPISPKINSEYLLQIQDGKGDAGSNVVNFYVKTRNDEWLWFYVDHESLGRGWDLRFKNESQSSVEIVFQRKVVAEYHVESGQYCIDGKFHSKGEFKVIGTPLTQDYPVAKERTVGSGGGP